MATPEWIFGKESDVDEIGVMSGNRPSREKALFHALQPGLLSPHTGSPGLGFALVRTYTKRSR